MKHNGPLSGPYGPLSGPYGPTTPICSLIRRSRRREHRTLYSIANSTPRNAKLLNASSLSSLKDSTFPISFPQVVKNVASQSLEVKKLVYLYLLHYAEKRPNEALLSINSFQKDLGDTNPLVRAWALRTMAGIRLHVIAPLVLVAVGKCAKDTAVYVRKCAANALPKLHDLHLEENSSTIEEIVGTLLSDSSPGVVGAAAAAFTSVCPNNYSLIGRKYRRLCEILPDVEEWEKDPHSEKDDSDDDFALKNDASGTSGMYDSDLARTISRCYIEGPDEYLSRTSYANRISFEFSGAKFTSGRSNDEVKILLQGTSPLLWSNNSAVVVAAAGVHWIMAPREEVKRIVKPLLFLLRSSSTSKYVVLCNIQVFAKAMPSLFSPYFEDFFVVSSDSYQIKALKLEIICSIATDSSISSIFKEFQDYIRDPDRRFAADAVAAIGLCAKQIPNMARTCLEGLLALTRQDFSTCDSGSTNGEAGILIQAIVSIKSIIAQDPPTHEKVVIQLVRSLDSIKVPAARATIIWMIGEYRNLGEIIPRMLTIVLKYLAWSFTSEALETKLQILNTTVKVLSGAKGEEMQTFKKLGSYVIELADCDLNYDVRDRARFLKKLLPCSLDHGELEVDTNCLPKQQDLPQLQDMNLSQNLAVFLITSLIQSHGVDTLGEGVDGTGSLSGSSYEESASDYSSEQSMTVSSGDGGSDETSSTGEVDNTDPLIQLSDTGDANQNQNGAPQSASTDLEELMSKRSLETWLGEQPGLSIPSTSEQSQLCKSSARISIRDISSRVKPKSYRLLDPANGNGLKVDYSFSPEISSISPLLVSVQVSFENCTDETISEVTLVDEESSKASDSSESSPSHKDVPTLVPMEEIASLEPGQTVKKIVYVCFHHHLLPLKLALYCNGKKLSVKLRPDIGYFVKPLPMDFEAFKEKESRLPGMFEYTRSFTFVDHIGELNKESSNNALVKDNFLLVCESLALKMLSNANFSLVSVDMPISAKHDDVSGLCLRFSGEILSKSMPCLITITAEGKCSEPLNVLVKVNCEETVFGLNLLNRIVNFLS
ncbi:hypothetical protein OIU84_019812 [Salix udensis]|uniref:AP-3 complex subunit beta n=1 Tax=Salix udensis TaxID=889485 RepID=A0AAD6PJW6_9ROSI|nr:hypothetical protein OIU84_019812 [Salix udensis]